MKKRIIKIVAFATACALSSTLFVGCQPEHEHSVGTWSVVKEATCTTEGLKKGICGDKECFMEVEKVIPIDPENHVYGEWEITKPTSSARGKAVKTCTENPEHESVTVTLHSFSDPKAVYEIEPNSSKMITRPTATSDGIREYTVKHELGDIVFQVPVERNAMTVLDAVELGSSVESHNLVRTAVGEMSSDSYEAGQHTSLISNASITYELYDTYTHIDAPWDNRERWVSYDSNGEVYTILDSKDDGFIEESARDAEAKQFINGFGFYLHNLRDMGMFYGTENLLKGMYTHAKENINNDFTQNIEKKNGKTVYSFNFGYLQASGATDGHYGQIAVEFTLFDNYVIESLSVYAKDFINNTYEGIYTWEVVDDVARPISGLEMSRYHEDAITVTQTLRKEGEEELTTPHDKENMFITDFDITYKGEVVTDDTVVSFDAHRNGNSSYDFGLTNILPSKRLDNEDGFSFYLRRTIDGKLVDVPVDWDTMNTAGMTMYVNSSNRFYINSHIAGEFDFVVKTQKVEKVMHLNIGFISPTSISPSIYKYSRRGYSLDTSATSATVYVGQPLYFDATVSEAEKPYCSNETTLSVTSGNADNCVLVEKVNGKECGVTKENVNIKSFTAKKAGNYTITLTSALDSSQKTTINVTVVEKPDFSEILSGTYTATLKYPRGTATITFTALGNDVYQAKIEHNGITEYLNCIVDVNAQTMTSVHADGSEERNFKITLNEAYDLVLENPTTFEEAEGVQLIEKVIMIPS